MAISAKIICWISNLYRFSVLFAHCSDNKPFIANSIWLQWVCIDFFVFDLLYFFSHKRIPRVCEVRPNCAQDKMKANCHVKVENGIETNANLNFIFKSFDIIIWLFDYTSTGVVNQFALAWLFVQTLPFVNIGKHIMHTRDYRKHDKQRVLWPWSSAPFLISENFFTISKYNFISIALCRLSAIGTQLCTSENEVSIATLFIW